jgi:hypothetical protein
VPIIALRHRQQAVAPQLQGVVIGAERGLHGQRQRSCVH